MFFNLCHDIHILYMYMNQFRIEYINNNKAKI